MIDKYNVKLIGSRLKKARENAGFTQYRLHDLTGISITQISAYENGNRMIGLASLKKIAEATGTTMDELYSGNGDERPVLSALNEGKLIINCITALFENKVIGILSKEKKNDFVPSEIEYYYQIGFCDYIDILDDFVNKMDDFESNKDDYSKPEEFRNQIIEAASKKINDVIAYRKKHLY